MPKELQIDKLDFNERSLISDTIFQQAPIGIAISYSNEPVVFKNNLVRINPELERITGRTYKELVKLGWDNITHPDDIEEDMNNLKKLQRGEIDSYSMEKRYIKPDGSNVWVYIVVAKFNLQNDYKYNYICLVQDISDRKAVEKALVESERSKSVLLASFPGMAYRCNYDHEWTMQFVSDGCFELTGYTSDNLLYNKDLSFNDLINSEYRDLLWNEWDRKLKNKQPFKYEYEITTAKGERKWVIEFGQGVFNKQGDIEALEGIILDITDRKNMESSLEYINEIDTWTGLYNRRYLENLLVHDAKIVTTKKRAVVSINLSAVQLLSMTYGFHYSQELIKKVADNLKSLCNDDRQLFNTYENRFVFYVKAYKDKNELVEFCWAITKIIEPILIIEKISVGIGVVEIDEDNKKDVELILKNLLISSEKARRNIDKYFGFCFFDAEMEAQLLREQNIILELTKIVEDENCDSLYLQFQPILDIKTNQICEFEALARIKNDELGPISPLEFIPIAEKTKLIIPLGDIIIRKALRFLKLLEENGHDKIGVSINVSGIQMLRNDFLKNLFDIIHDMQVNPSNIGLEITESIFFSNYQDINYILAQLKAFGIKIAIDDFGTGYSSLARERELNVNCLKIDKYFIDNLLSLKSDEAITGDIISMAHKLGHNVVAEGVEHNKQRQYLLKHGCDKIQGYLISKPVDEEIAINLIKIQYI
ncbi:MAG: EAL domain-containing protein [Anaerolineaceae bacterium]|nr:MAG: EAL domain-containing protein [Anaerolineaceae bacterium]